MSQEFNFQARFMTIEQEVQSNRCNGNEMRTTKFRKLQESMK